MCLEFELFRIRKELSFASPTAIFVNVIFWHGDERIAIMGTARSLISSFRFDRYDTEWQCHDVIFLDLENGAIDRAVRKYRTFHEYFASIFC